jgi:hypothetical protein
VCKVNKAVLLQAWRSPKGSRRLRLLELIDSWHMKVARLSDSRTGCLYPLLPWKIPVTHFYQRLSGRPQGHSASGKIKSMKYSIDLIGNWTRDLSACGTVPQPTVGPYTPFVCVSTPREYLNMHVFFAIVLLDREVGRFLIRAVFSHPWNGLCSSLSEHRRLQ